MKPTISLHEILVLRYKDALAGTSISPNGGVIGFAQTDILDMVSLMPFLPQCFRQGRRQLGIDKKASHLGCPHNGVIHFRSGEFKARLDVFRLEVRKIGEYLLLGHSSRKHLKHVLHPNTHTPNAGAAAALLGVEGDPIEVFHARTLI